MSDDRLNGENLSRSDRRVIVVGVSMAIVVLSVAVGGFYSAIYYLVRL